MSERRTVIYRYDGSLEGLLCCVFESYERREMPIEIFSPASPELSLYPVREIASDRERAARVWRSIPQKISPQAAEWVRLGYLTCEEQKELLILRFLRLGYRVGPQLTRMLANEVVHRLDAAVRYLLNERQRYLQFLRFSDYQGMLIAEIEPRCMVLPLLREHFTTRYSEETFLIYDRTHAAALVYRPFEARILPLEALAVSPPGEEELRYRSLWRMFYQTVSIQERYNPRCRMTHLPKRYWDCMTEFQAGPCEEKTEGRNPKLVCPKPDRPAG